MQSILFKGRKYLLVGDKTGGGAIATKRQYEHGLCSHAHLTSDGRIMRFQKQIGTIKDIKFGKNVKTKSLLARAFKNILCSCTWGQNNDTQP